MNSYLLLKDTLPPSLPPSHVSGIIASLKHHFQLYQKLSRKKIKYFLPKASLCPLGAAPLPSPPTLPPMRLNHLRYYYLGL